MFSEEECPYCANSDYKIQDYEEDYWNNWFTREWYCKCSNCKSDFTITYYYELKKVEVS